MSRHTQMELEQLSDHMAAQCRRVEAHLGTALQAFLTAPRTDDPELIRADESIDREEVQIEEECLKIIALHQPTGIDLRRLATFLKANSDLERIGDHATNLVRSLPRLPAAELCPQAAALLARSTEDAFRSACRALTEHDLDAAETVLAGDDVIDALEDALTAGARELAQSGSGHLESAFELAKCAHELERIADLAKNIAEDIVYLDTGDIVRHVRNI